MYLHTKHELSRSEVWALNRQRQVRLQTRPFTMPHLQVAVIIVYTFYLHNFFYLIVWQSRHAADTSTNWRQSLLCCCTASMEQATDGAETAAIDGLVSSWSENIFVSFCLQAPGYGVTLWCALGLLVGAQYKCLSYSYSCNDIICYASSQSLSSTTDAKSNLLTMPFKASKVSVLCQRVWMRGKLVSLVV